MATKKVEVLLQDIKDYALQKAATNLIESGVDVNVLDVILDKFRNTITTGGTIGNLTDELAQAILGSDKTSGILERYTKQVNSDSLTQFVASYNEVLTVDSGLEFYYYVGNVQTDTRCFCEQRANKYFHRKEIENWGRGKVMDGVDGENCGYPWQGMIKGTNESNIFINRGGYFCNHQIVSTLTKRVPADVIARAESKGYYTPKK